MIRKFSILVVLFLLAAVLSFAQASSGHPLSCGCQEGKPCPLSAVEAANEAAAAAERARAAANAASASAAEAATAAQAANAAAARAKEAESSSSGIDAMRQRLQGADTSTTDTSSSAASSSATGSSSGIDAMRQRLQTSESSSSAAPAAAADSPSTTSSSGIDAMRQRLQASESSPSAASTPAADSSSSGGIDAMRQRLQGAESTSTTESSSATESSSGIDAMRQRLQGAESTSTTESSSSAGSSGGIDAMRQRLQGAESTSTTESSSSEGSSSGIDAMRQRLQGNESKANADAMIAKLNGTAEEEVAGIPEGIRNNEYYLESLRLSKLAHESYDKGLYDESAAYAEEAIHYAHLSDLYVTEQLIAEAKRLLDWADSNNIETRYPNVYNAGKDYYNESVTAQDKSELRKANIAAINSIEIFGPMAAEKPASLPSQYTVRSWANEKDCFWNIAGYPFVYGDPWKWRELYNANRSKLPNPNNPNVIEPGTILDIPALPGETRSGMWTPNGG